MDDDEDALKAQEDGLRSDIVELKAQIEENELIHGIPSKGMRFLTEEYLDSSSRAHRLASTREGILSKNDNGVEDVTTEDYEKTYPYITTDEVTPSGGGSPTEPVDNVAKTMSQLPRDVSASSMTEQEDDFNPGLDPEQVRDEHRGSGMKTDSTGGRTPGIDPNDVMGKLRAIDLAQDGVESIFEETNTIKSGGSSAANGKGKHSKSRKSVPTGGESEEPNQGHSSAMDQQQSHFRFSEQAPQPPATMSAAVLSANGPLPPTKANIQLAASGGGIITNEKSTGLPLHTNDLETLRPHLTRFCHEYNIQMNIQSIRSSADEMELFSVINRKFRHIFNKQEEMRTFKAYDTAKSAAERWGMENWTRAVKKPSNWISYVHLRPKRNEHLVKLTMELRSGTAVDDLLKAASNFLQLKSPEKVQDSLRHHAMLVQHPPMIHAASVVSHRQGQSTAEVFKKIYNHSDLYGKSSSQSDEPGKRNDDYDFTQSMQMLGLDDVANAKDDPSSVQGAYLSFLHLRHLKLREVMRTSLSVMNYFRSIERTLTISDQGLSMNAKGGVERTSPPNHRTGTETQGHQGGGNTLEGHGYLFNSPHEFKIKETEFMQFAEVDNHDDFYFHDEGRVHVRDQVGFWIVYDCAIDDFSKLEQDMLLLATAFIQKDTGSRASSNFKRKQANTDGQSNDIDIAMYAHREIDRFGVLFDMWVNECAFQEAKKNLMDVYMEVYGHIVTRDSRRRLAQVMTDLIFQRPRLDLNESYFVLAYRYECAILRQRTEAMRSILNRQISNQREYLKRVHLAKTEFGLPPPVLEKFPIAPSSDETLLTPVFLLEFHPSLSCTPSLVEAMDQSVHQLFQIFTPSHPMQEIVLEKRFFDYLRYEVETLKPLGGSYTPQLQRDIFSPHYIEDAVQMCELSSHHLAGVQLRNSRGDKKTRQMFLLNELGRLLDLITIRHRLMDCMWECEVLSKIYLTTANEMGFDDFHLFIRPLQFEAAKYKEGADDLRPPIYITAIQDDDSTLDKFLPSALPLAIHELDETHVGKFSFRGKLTIMEMLEARGVENLLTILKAQTAHKNALAASIMLAFTARPSFYTAHVPKSKNGVLRPSSTGANLVSYTGLSGTQVGPTPLALERSKHQLNAEYHPEAFFSVQLEKVPCRDRMQNSFIKRTQGGGIASSKSSVESEKMKREFISQFCADFGQRTQHTSLRAQIITTYSSILTILQKVPTITEDFFLIGYAFEKKTPDDDLDVQVTDPRSLRNRPRRVLSTDGSKLYNFWFIPHFIEVLFIFRHLDDQACTRALRCMARLATVLHDVLHYLVAYARLGISSAKITPEQREQILAGSMKDSRGANRENLPNASESAYRVAGAVAAETSFAQIVSAGTTNGMNMALSSPALSVTPLGLSVHGQSLVVDQTLATELREIQYQINRLPDPYDPEQVVEMLILRRDTMFLQFDVCMRTILCETFLAAGNLAAFQEVKENSHFPLAEMSNCQRACLNAIEMNVPEPMEARDELAQTLFPYRSLMNIHGPFFLFYNCANTIEYNIRLCMAGLKPVDRPTVHGELLAMNLSLEDALEVGELIESKAGEPMPIQHVENMHCILGKRVRDRRREAPGAAAAAQPPGGAPAANTGGGATQASTGGPPATNLLSADSKAILPTGFGSGVAVPVEDLAPKLNTLDSPVASYILLKKFLMLWKRVDLLKYAWGCRRLGVEAINTPALFKTFSSIYKREKLLSLLRSLSIQYKQSGMYSMAPLDSTDIFVMPKGIPEMVARQRQLLKLMEAFEFYMISDLRKLIVKQTDMVIKERNREEGNLPLELWKRPAMKEALSVKRTGLADEIVVLLTAAMVHDEKKNVFTVTGDKLNTVIQNVAIAVMRMQRESYENYSMYYENLIKNQHSLLYGREREIVGLNEAMRQKEVETSVTVQFQMSEQAHNLLLEVTALRARISELEEVNVKTENKIRLRVRREFSAAMRKLFGLSFEQKARIDEYRDHLHSITLQRIAEVREEASAEMARIKERSGARASAEDELAERNLRLSREVNTLHQRNVRLQQMMTRLRVMAQWQQITLRCAFEKQINGVEEQRNHSKSQVTRLGILSEQRVRMLNEEMAKLRDHLSNTEKHLGDLRKALDKEMNDKIEKRHTAERKAATDKQMAMVKQMKIEQLKSHLADKEAILAQMGTQLAASAKSKKQEADKSVREVDLLRKQLREERKLKKSAIHKVDDLMSQLYEFETAYSIQANKEEMATSSNPVIGDGTIRGPLKKTATKQRPVTVGIPLLRQRIAQQLLRNGTPQPHMHFLRMHEENQTD